jgi:hypothetical protein
MRRSPLKVYEPEKTKKDAKFLLTSGVKWVRVGRCGKKCGCGVFCE